MNNERNKDMKITVLSLIGFFSIILLTVGFSVIGTAVVTMFTPTDYLHDLKFFTLAVMTIQYLKYTLFISKLAAKETYDEEH